MLLVDPAEAAVAINASCKGQVASDNDSLITILKYVTPRVEDALNVKSIARGVYRDEFYLPHMPHNVFKRRRTVRMRLSNGFLLDGGTITITDPRGNVVTLTSPFVYQIAAGDSDVAGASTDPYVTDPQDIEVVNNEFGFIDLSRWQHGHYTVQYTSGFALPALPDPLPTPWDAEAQVYQNVPDWIRAMCSVFAVQWFRTMPLAPKLPNNVKLNAFDAMIRKELYVRVYGRYLRPRSDCVWSEQMTNVS